MDLSPKDRARAIAFSARRWPKSWRHEGPSGVVVDGVGAVVVAAVTYAFLGDAWQNAAVPMAAGISWFLLWHYVLRPLRNYIWSVPVWEHVDLWKEIDARDAQINELGAKVRGLESDINEVRRDAENKLPKFYAYIDNMAFEDPENGLCLSYLLVSIDNRGGSASTLKHWRMFVQEPGKPEREVEFRQPARGEDCSLVTDNSGNEALINASEFISEKAYATAVQPGNSVRGFVRVAIPAGLADGTRFILRFWDVFHREYECEYDTAARRERASDVRALGNWPTVDIRHKRVTLLK